MADRPHPMPHTTLETHHEEGESWEPYEGSDGDPYDAYIDSGAPPGTNGGGHSRANPPYLASLPTHSQPNLTTPGSERSPMALPTPDFRSPPPEYDTAIATEFTADFSRLRMSDPNPQPRGAPGDAGDQSAAHALPTSQTSQSLNGVDWRAHHPPPSRSMTMPPTPQMQPGWTGPPRSASVSRPMKGYGVPEVMLDNGDGASVYSVSSGHSAYGPAPPQMHPGAPGYGAPRGPYPAYYGGSPWQQQQQQYGMGYGQPQPTFAQPPPAQYDPLYAAASEMLGPPPGAQSAQPPGMAGAYPAPMPPPNQSLSPYPQQGPPQGGLYRGPSIAASMRSHYSGNSAHSGSSGGSTTTLPTTLQRSTTSASSVTTLNTRKTKAVDLRQPPFTKEYIDQYRARIKVDPDPEAHFQYGKYLIEAAKKVGAHAADQKAVRKYRDALITEALKVIRKLATQNDPVPDAQFFLANCYGTGMLGLAIDHEKAYHLYVSAAKLRHPAASYRVAVCNELGAGTKRELGRAVAFYRQAASLGDTPAMYKLGMVLLTGQLGQHKDEKEAIKWLRRAAEQADEENPHALHELGLLHESGESSVVLKDDAYAKELFTRAGNLGYTKSCLKLGACYEYGTLACPVDPKRSIAWYTRAAEKNDPEAELALSGWYLTGCDGVLKQSDHEAYLWARRAANKGLPKAEYAVGYYAEVGIGIKPDIEFARKWYLRAAAQGHQRSKERLTQLKMQNNKRLARPTRQEAKDECVIM